MDRIEEILNQRGLSKAAFAELMGTSRQNVNALLKNPTRVKLEKIASALDVPVWQLFASPEEVASQEFVAFFYHKGKTSTPTDMKTIIDILISWREEEFHKICHKYSMQYIRDHYTLDLDLQHLLDRLCAMIECDDEIKNNETKNTEQ